MNDVTETNGAKPGNGRITAKDPATKLAHKRLSVLQLAGAWEHVQVHRAGRGAIIFAEN